MSGHNQVFFEFYDIDIDKAKPQKIDIGKSDVPTYVESLLDEISSKENRSRSYSLESENTEVFASLLRYFNKELEQAMLSQIIADRLHRSEKGAQKKIGHIQKVKKGSLVQVLIQEYGSGELNFIVAKVEDNYFLDKSTLAKKVGLPWEKSTFKYAWFTFSADYTLIDITVYDANPKFSDYWHKEFLELRESNSDENNTKAAFNSIKLVLDRNVKKQSRQDYTILKNSTINYFRSHEIFSYEQLMNDVFDQYKPENPSLDMKKIREKLRELPSKKQFDRAFKVINSEIKARISQRYEISDKIEIKIKDSLENIKDTIYSMEDPDGKRFIKVQVDNEETYELFNFRQDSKE